MKVQFVLEEQEVLETLNDVTSEPKASNMIQHRRDREAYEAWKKNNSLAHIMLLSNMDYDLLRDIKVHANAKDLCEAVKIKFGTT